MDFNNDISSKICVIDKRTGKAAIGSEFTTDINATPDDLKRQNSLMQAAGNDRKKQMELAAHLMQTGDFDTLKRLGLGGGFGGGSAEQIEDYEDAIADLKAELRGEESRADQLEDELEKVQDELDQTKEEMAKMNARLAEYRFYKQKVEFLEKENEMQLMKMKEEQEIMGGMGGGGFNVDLDEASATFQVDPSLLNADPAKVTKKWAQQAQDQLKKLLGIVAAKDRQIAQLRTESGSFLDEDQLRALAMTDGSVKGDALQKILVTQRQMQSKLKGKQTELDKMQRTVQMLQQRDKFNNELRKNWQTQLQQMEQAVLLCSQIHGRDRKRFAAELAEKEEQILKLKAYVQKMNEMRNRHNKNMYGSSARIRLPVGRKGGGGGGAGPVLISRDRIKKRRDSYDAS